MKHQRSEALFEQAQRSIPGGVNSPVRAFRGVGGKPIFFEKGQGPWLTDVDGNRYVDYVGSWGPLLFGHAWQPVVDAVCEAARSGTSFGAPHAAEVDFAELICSKVPSVEKVRLVSSGTEATMAAIRLARAVTGRDRVLKFDGCYHGASDSLLVKAGSGVETLGLPDSPGVPADLAQHTLTLPFNDIERLKSFFAEHGDTIACAILEPVVGNMGVLLPRPGFHEALRELTEKHGTVLIWDEVMTGFRLSPAGAQGRFGITPDLTTFGKVIGGGLPVGAYGGKRELMSQIAPEGPVYQAGTLSGNPLAVAAGMKMLEALDEAAYERLEQQSARLYAGIEDALRATGAPVRFNRVGSMWTLYFTPDEVWDAEGARKSDTTRFGKFYWACLERGVYLSPSQFESNFVSLAHDDEAIEHTVRGIRGALEAVA